MNSKGCKNEKKKRGNRKKNVRGRIMEEGREGEKNKREKEESQ